MKWFGSKSDDKMVALPPVSLTEEEHQECQAFVSAMIPQSDEGQWVMKEELIEPFKRNLVAMCMIGRAKKFAIQAESDGLEYRDQAREAAAKACAIYPLSAYFYDFACILEAVGEEADARIMFKEFLRRHDLGPENELDQITLEKLDVETMVRDAQNKISV